MGLNLATLLFRLWTRQTQTCTCPYGRYIAAGYVFISPLIAKVTLATGCMPLISADHPPNMKGVEGPGVTPTHAHTWLSLKALCSYY